MTLIQYALSCLAVVGTIQASIAYPPKVLPHITLGTPPPGIIHPPITLGTIPPVIIPWLPLINRCHRQVCYVTNWSQHEAGVTFPSKFLFDIFLCSHVIVARAQLRVIKSRRGEYYLAFDIDPLTEQQVKLLKKVRKGTKALLSVGLMDVSSRMIPGLPYDFVEIKKVWELGFDGLDLYYPASCKTPLEDKQNFNLLIKRMRSFLKKDAKEYKLQKPMLMTATLPADKATVHSGFDIPSLGRDLDFVNLQTYDSPEDSDVKWRHVSPLFGDAENTREHNVDFYAKNWIEKGFPKEKIVIGIPAYGSSFSMEHIAHDYVTYNEVCEMINDGAKVKRLPKEKVPYLIHGSKLVSFDDPQSVTSKAKYVKAKGYGGVMMKFLDASNATACNGYFFPFGDPLLSALTDECLQTEYSWST